MPRILQLTDLHIFADRTERLKGIDTATSLEKVVHHIIETGTEFDHLVMTGDHTHDEQDASYAFVKSQFERLSSRWWQVPGNHDDRPVLRSVFANVDGEGDAPIRFCFDDAEWTCIGLDSHVPGLVAGRIDESQIEWLNTQLSASKSQHIALFLHHPPVDIQCEWMDQIGLENRDLLADVVKSDNRIQLIVCGHVHHDFCSSLHQATVLATPSTGIQFHPEGATPAFSNDSPGYRIIELNSDGWNSEVVRVPEAAGVVE